MATWRDHEQHHEGSLFLLVPEVIFAARVNQSSFTFPLAQLTYDGVTVGAFGDARAGMTVLIGSTLGGDDLGRTYVRKDLTSALLYFGWSSQGVRDGEVDPTDNAYITILNDFRVWMRTPRIVEDTFYKVFDLELGDFGTEPPPVANAGCGVGEEIDSITGLITVAFPNDSFAVADGATLATYLWEVDDGTITVGTSASAEITATFPAGFRYVHLTVTDSNGKTHTCHVPVLADDPDDTLLISSFEVDTQILRMEGQEFRVRIKEDIPASTYPDGTLVMYWEREVYDGVAGSLYGPAGREHMKFIGWVQREPTQIDSARTGLLRETELECVDVAGRLNSLPGFTQLVEQNAAPANWTQMANANIDRYLHYLLHWHSTALDVADFQWSGLGDDYPFVALGSDGQSLYDQVDQRAKAIVHRLTCDMRGYLWVLPDPNLIDPPGGTPATPVTRTTTVQQTLTAVDFSRIAYTSERPPRVHWLRGNAIVASPTAISAVFAIAPGEAPGQGQSAQEQGQQLVTDQEELNAREGHRYGRLNATESLYDIELTHGNDGGIEPARMVWAGLTISPSVAAQRGLTFTNERFLPVEVQINHRQSRTGRYKQVTLRAEREVTNTPAQTVIEIPDPSLPNYTPGYLVLPTVVQTELPGPDAYALAKGMKNIAAFNRDGYVYITRDFNTPASAGGPSWDDTQVFNTGTDGVPLSFVVDAFSPRYLDTGSEVNGWVATTTKIFRVTDIFGTIGATLQHTFAAAASVFGSQGRNIKFGWGFPNWGLCVSYYNSSGGTKVAYTTNGGSSWTEVAITAHYQDHGFSNPSLHISSKVDGRAYVQAFKTTATGSNDAVSAIYKTTDHGASWAEITSGGPVGLGETIVGSLEVPWHDNPSELIAFYCSSGVQGGRNASQFVYRIEADGTTRTDITPIISTKRYTSVPAAGYWGIYAAPEDRQRMILCAFSQDESGNTLHNAVFISRDGGNNWSPVFGPNVPGTDVLYYQGVISGTNVATLYTWGSAGAIGHSQDSGDSGIEDKRGNIPTDFPSIGIMLGICGG